MSHERQQAPAKPRMIAFFLSAMTHGGAERVALLLSAAMTKLGHKVYIFLARREGQLLSLIPESVELISLDCGTPIHGTLELGRQVNQLNPDVLIAFGVHSGIAAAISKTRTKWRAPIIIRNESNIASEWMNSNLHNRIIGPILSRWAARKSKIVCVSESLRSPTANFLRLENDDVGVILNPVLLSSPAFDKELYLHPWLAQKTTPTFISAGRLEPQKDFITLLNAFKIAQERVKCRLIIFGEGSLRNMLEQHRNSLGLEDCVSLPGATSSTMLQMRNSTAFILSSRWEGFGLVLVEALLAGTKVIATNCNYGPSEILEQGRYGTLVPVADETAMANAIVDAATEKGALPLPSPDWFDKFSPETAALKHLEIIERLDSAG